MVNSIDQEDRLHSRILVHIDYLNEPRAPVLVSVLESVLVSVLVLSRESELELELKFGLVLVRVLLN